MKLKYFEWSSEMSKTIKSLAVVALLATPTFAAADGHIFLPAIAASLSASFGEGSFQDSNVVVDDSNLTTVTEAQSVSVAGAMGYYAVATSAATMDARSATSGSAIGNSMSVNDELTPMVEVTMNGNAYETTVRFNNPSVDEDEIIAAICGSLWARQTQGGDQAQVLNGGVSGGTTTGSTQVNNGEGGTMDEVLNVSGSTLGALGVDLGDITVNCDELPQ
jgi:hypothetical protein